jgi:hypothetical protein
VDIHKDSNLAGKINEGMITIEVLIINSPAYDRKAVLIISKAIFAKVMPPGFAPGLYSFRRFRRRIRYNEIAYNGCAEGGQI